MNCHAVPFTGLSREGERTNFVTSRVEVSGQPNKQNMTTTLDSKIFGPLFGDSEINELLTDQAYVRALVEVETALARAEARLGVIPSSAAEQICSGAQWNKIDIAALAKGTARSGVPYHRSGPGITQSGWHRGGALRALGRDDAGYHGYRLRPPAPLRHQTLQRKTGRDSRDI